MKKPSTAGMLYIIFIFMLLIVAAMIITGGIVPLNREIPASAAVPVGEQIIISPQNKGVQSSLQLQTFGVKTCQQTLAVDLLVDTSGSMSHNNKLSQLKQALTLFLGKLSDNSVVGMQTFSSGAKNISDLNNYRTNRNLIASAVSKLSPNGFTYTREAFALAEQKLSDAISQNKFPNYTFALIFISDGVPEYTPDLETNNCVYRLGDRCFSKTEDPRIPTDIPLQIKNMGVKIFSIEIYGTDDAPFKSYEEKLFQDVSSQPLSTYYYETINANDLPKIFDTISTKVCN